MSDSKPRVKLLIMHNISRERFITIKESLETENVLVTPLIEPIIIPYTCFNWERFVYLPGELMRSIRHSLSEHGIEGDIVIVVKNKLLDSLYVDDNGKNKVVIMDENLDPKQAIKFILKRE